MWLLGNILWIVGGFLYVVYKIHQETPGVISDCLKLYGYVMLPFLPSCFMYCFKSTVGIVICGSLSFAILGKYIYDYIIEANKNAEKNEIRNQQTEYYLKAKEIADALPAPTKEEMRAFEKELRESGRNSVINCEREWRYEKRIQLYKEMLKENNIPFIIH